MMAALITLWKHPKWAAAPMAAALIILLLGSSGWVSKSLVRSLEWQNLPTAELPQAEAIIVLGGGVKAALRPRPWVELGEAGDRIIYGSRLYRQGKAPLLILSGGRVDWKGGGLSRIGRHGRNCPNNRRTRISNSARPRFKQHLSKCRQRAANLRC